jgi:hypothetical protein
MHAIVVVLLLCKRYLLEITGLEREEEANNVYFYITQA